MKIINSEERAKMVTGVKIVIFGPYGIGKTSLLIPILNNNETNEKECFLPITRGLSGFIVYSICLPNNEVWY